MSIQPRFDEKRGIYRDCKWCGGKGCIYCPAEAEMAYRAEFPNGPEPIATFERTEAGMEQMAVLLDATIGKGAGEQLRKFLETPARDES